MAKSSRARGTPISRAMASRCRTPLVEPPVAAMEKMAFSRAPRVMIRSGRKSSFSNSMIRAPTCRQISSFFGCVAGTQELPMMEMPRHSMAVDMVLAVNWPPHAPGPGQALHSSS